MRYGFSDITIYSNSDEVVNRDFSIRNALISDLYVDFLDGYKPKGVTRISVHIDTEDNVKTQFGSILHVDITFDDEDYLAGTPEKQDHIILNTIHRAALLAAEKFEWDKNVFEQAYNKVVASGFIYKKETKKKRSKNKQYQAALLVEKNGDSAVISVNFYDSNAGHLKTVKLMESFHHYISFRQIERDNNKWFSDHEFGIHMAKGQIQIKASLQNSEAETVFNPSTTTIERLEGYLRSVTYRTFANQFEYAQWANQ